MFNDQPRISVVIPVYNKRPHLLRATQSVLAQSFTQFELILVDDGSTDNSLDAIAHLKDARIKTVWQPNGGVSAARNTGVHLAKAPLVAFLDADDTWEPEFLSAMMALRMRYPNAGLYASHYNIKSPAHTASPARITGLPLLRRQFKSHGYFRISSGGELPVTASSVLIPRERLLAIGGFPVGERMGEDQHVWWQLCVQSPFAFDRRCLATYHRDASNRACPDNVPSSELPFSKRLINDLPTLEINAWQCMQAKRYMGAHLLHLARENLRIGRFEQAAQLLNDPRTRWLPLKRLVRKMEYLRGIASSTPRSTLAITRQERAQH